MKQSTLCFLGIQNWLYVVQPLSSSYSSLLRWLKHPNFKLTIKCWHTFFKLCLSQASSWDCYIHSGVQWLPVTGRVGLSLEELLGLQGSQHWPCHCTSNNELAALTPPQPFRRMGLPSLQALRDLGGPFTFWLWTLAWAWAGIREGLN